MSDIKATSTFKHTYTDPEGDSRSSSPLIVESAYAEGAQAHNGIDVPDTAAADTVYNVPVGSIARLTFLRIRNRLAQEVGVMLDVEGSSVSGTLVAGTATLALAEVPGERLTAVLGDDNGGTPGYLHVRRDGGDVIVESYTSDGIQDEDVSDVTVYSSAPLPLPPGSVLVYASPTAPEGAALASATVRLSSEQDGAGSIATMAFGDPNGD